MAKSVSKKTSSNAANLVRLWLKQKPFMHWLVREGLINYTALAKRLALEGFASGKRPIAALRAALLRARKLDFEGFNPFGSNDVLSDAKFEIRTGVTVVKSQKALPIAVIAVASSKNGVISIIDSEQAKRITRNAKIIEENQVLITIYSDERMEKEPGVLATLLLHLALQNVNVVEMTSAGPDTLLVISPKDLPAALGVLQGLMLAGKKSKGEQALFSYSIDAKKIADGKAL
jgi:hypothetical protein